MHNAYNILHIIPQIIISVKIQKIILREKNTNPVSDHDKCILLENPTWV